MNIFLYKRKQNGYFTYTNQAKEYIINMVAVQPKG